MKYAGFGFEYDGFVFMPTAIEDVINEFYISACVACRGRSGWSISWGAQGISERR